MVVDGGYAFRLIIAIIILSVIIQEMHMISCLVVKALLLGI